MIKKISFNLFTVSVIVIISYLLLEIVLTISLAYHVTLPKVKKNYISGFGNFCSAPAKFDSLTAFRLTRPFRIFKTANHQLIYDQLVTPNKNGFNSVLPYEFKKNKKRFIVFGDSFTGSIYLDSTWVDKLNNVCSPDTIEFYNFAQDGTGIGNWHHIFLNEVNPKFEFDGLIFAVFGNDLARDRFVMHQQGPYTYLGEIPNYHISTDSLKKILPAFYAEENIVSNISADSIIAADTTSEKTKFGFRACKYLKENIENIVYNFLFKRELDKMFYEYIYSPNQQKTKPSINSIKKKYGKNFDLLNQILDTCRANNKEIIFCAVPELYGVNLNKNGKATIIQQELEVITTTYHTGYFDGYSAFKNYNDSLLQESFLPYDGHFSKTGASIFAKEFRAKICY